MGEGSAGHYVKMVHNGIEYGIMQIICEIYDVLRKSAGMTTLEIRDVFAQWAQTEISSFLLDITVECLGKKDPETGRSLVELVYDTAGQKGTGKWTAQSALDLGVPIPTLALAVEARILSGLKAERVEASKILKAPKAKFTGKREALISSLFSALYLGKVACYAQGMALIEAASKEYNYGVNLSEVARIWKAGCIIRSKLLDPIKKAYRTKKELPNLMGNRYFRGIVNRNMRGLRSVITAAVKTGVPVTCLGGTLAYVDSYRSEFLPANLLQALRGVMRFSWRTFTVKTCAPRTPRRPAKPPEP
jgi:6-phosphogluconate dehydrogenase